MARSEDKVEKPMLLSFSEKHNIINMYGCIQLWPSWRLTVTAVNGDNYLFGESVSLIG